VWTRLLACGALPGAGVLEAPTWSLLSRTQAKSCLLRAPVWPDRCGSRDNRWSTDRDKLLGQALAVAEEGPDAGFCRVLQSGPDGRSLVVTAGAGRIDDRAGGRIDATDSMSQYSYVLARREPVASEDFAFETRFAPFALLR
jgi:hypothetical protein